MRKPLAWTLVLAFVGLALVASACAPEPLPEELQKSRTEEATQSAAPVEQTAATAAEAASVIGVPAAEPTASESTESTTAAAQPEKGKETSGGGVGGDIFRTGMNQNGPVAFTGGDGKAVAPCVQCHGLDGSGGTAGDIRWPALSKAGYKDDTLRRAIVNGVNVKNKPMDKLSPRYTLSPHDLGALVAFVKSLK
jgi:mono/diheme cytochrome c family protein